MSVPYCKICGQPFTEQELAQRVEYQDGTYAHEDCHNDEQLIEEDLPDSEPT
jgi:hypothetical protein